jgi:phosphate-selective porin
MKRMLCVAGAAVAIFAMCGPGQAKTLEEILREKGVITEEDYKEAVKNNDMAFYKPGRGITVETRDGKFSANVGGRMQVRYTYTDVDDSSEDDESSFFIQRMKFWLQGNAFLKDLTYRFQYDFRSGNLEDAYIGYKFAEPFKLTIGQMKPAQARQELNPSSKSLFVERSLANDTFNVGRDLGVQATGSFAEHLVEYRIGGFNGNGPNRNNGGDDHMVALRLDINPLGEVEMDESSFGDENLLLNIGGSFISSNFVSAAADDVNNDNEVWEQVLGDPDDVLFAATFGDELEYELYTVNLHSRWRWATFGAEYYFLDAEPDEGGDFDADGYYIQGGYMIIPNTLELAARYSAIESDDDDAPEQFDEQQYQFGVNYYLAKHNAKLQADFTHINDDENDDADDNIVRLQAQLIF